MKKKKIDFEKDIPDKIDEYFFEKSLTIETLIIKCHLFIEYSLERFIDLMTNGRYESYSFDFTFSEKYKIALLLGLGEMDTRNEARLYITTLNKLRNQVAHNIEYDEKLLEEICYNRKYYDPKKHYNMSTYYSEILRQTASWNASRITHYAELYNKKVYKTEKNKD